MNPQKYPEVNYSDEDLSKVLNSYSLIEAIHEYLEPTTNHNSEYLLLRIDLLREVFGLDRNSGNTNAFAIDNLLSGYGRITLISILPFEGALELPDSIETEAHFQVSKQFKNDFDLVKEKVYSIHRAYITYIVLHSINLRLRHKSIMLKELIARGLPASEKIPVDEDY